MAIGQVMTKATLIEFIIMPELVNVPRKGIDREAAIMINAQTTALVASQGINKQIYRVTFYLEDIEGKDSYGNPMWVVKPETIMYSHHHKTYIKITNVGEQSPLPTSVKAMWEFPGENVVSPWLMIGQPDPFGVSR